MKTIERILIPRQIHTDTVTVDFHANPGTALFAFLANGTTCSYSFQNLDDGSPAVEAEVPAPTQLNFVLQGGNYRIIVIPRSPAEFNTTLAEIIPD